MLLLISVTAASAASAQATLTAIDGSQVNLDERTGKVLILAVGASWLPLSDKQADFANVLAKRYSGKNVTVYFISTDSVTAGSKNFASDESVKKFAFSNKLTVPVLRDSDGLVTFKKYGIEQVPSFIVVDKNGVRVGQPFGGIDPNFDITIPISRAVDKIL